MSNSFDPDKARHFVGLDLGPNCLQKISADDISLKCTDEKIVAGYGLC